MIYKYSGNIEVSGHSVNYHPAACQQEDDPVHSMTYADQHKARYLEHSPPHRSCNCAMRGVNVRCLRARCRVSLYSTRSFSAAACRQDESPNLKKAQVTDGDIARLAAKPLHPLTLADLCKYVPHSRYCAFASIRGLTLQQQTWSPTTINFVTTKISQFHTLHSSISTCPSHTVPSKPSIHRSRQPARIENPQQLCTFPVDTPALCRETDRHARG